MKRRVNLKKRSTPESKKYWDDLKLNALEILSWPKWKAGPGKHEQILARLNDEDEE